jgi:hypothetical protein
VRERRDVRARRRRRGIDPDTEGDTEHAPKFVWDDSVEKL